MPFSSSTFFFLFFCRSYFYSDLKFIREKHDHDCCEKTSLCFKILRRSKKPDNECVNFFCASPNYYIKFESRCIHSAAQVRSPNQFGVSWRHMQQWWIKRKKMWFSVIESIARSKKSIPFELAQLPWWLLYQKRERVRLPSTVRPFLFSDNKFRWEM